MSKLGRQVLGNGVVHVMKLRDIVAHSEKLKQNMDEILNYSLSLCLYNQLF